MSAACAAYPTELVARLAARPRLCDYGDNDLAEIEPFWCVWTGRRPERVPREFLLTWSWGAYGLEQVVELDQKQRLAELNGKRGAP